MLGIISLSSASVFAFSDVTKSDPNHPAVEFLTQEGVLQGRGETGTFGPEILVSRAEWLVMLGRWMKKNSIETPSDCTLDLPQDWFTPEYCWALQTGIIHHERPSDPIILAELLVTLERVFKWPGSEGFAWYSSAYSFALKTGLVESSVQPHHLMTRSQAAEILFRTIANARYHTLLYDAFLAELMLPSSLESFSSPDQLIGNVGALIRPFGSSSDRLLVAKGALYVPAIQFYLEVQKPGVLKQLSIQRTSVGQTRDLSKGRLLINGMTIQEGQFDVEDSLVTWSELNKTVIPSSPLLIEMNVDFDAEARGDLSYQFQVRPDFIRFDMAEELTEGLTISGQPIFTTSRPADVVTIANTDSKMKMPFIEETGQVIGRFVITAGEHDVLIKRIKLRDAGTMDDRGFSNFRLTVGSTELAYIPEFNRLGLDFVVSDYLIEAGRSRTLQVRADIDSARKSDTIRLYLDEPEDLHAFDIQYHFGTQIENRFSQEIAWCVGSSSTECPAEGLRKHCSKDDRERGVEDCEENEE